MPIYEFECSGCGERFETLVTGAGDPGPACPGCGNTRPRRRPSAFAVIGSTGPESGPDRARPAGMGCGADDCACRLD